MNPSKREQSIYKILKTSLELFHQNSYSNTTMRQIAEHSGSALGIINHYFGSKEFLGSQVLSLLDNYTLASISSYVALEDDPILYDLVSVRLLFYYIRDFGYWNFYLDALQHDFFFNHLSKRPPILINLLKEIYHFEADQDTILLYSRYLPYMMEKTVVLKKEEGLFPSIDYDEIPYLICQTAMEHFIPKSDILSRNEESKKIARKLVQTLEPFPPSQVIIDFIQTSEFVPL